MHTQWKQTKIKYIFNINNGSTPKSGIQEYWDGDITWITPADIKPNNSKPITKSKRKITKSGYKNCGTTLTPPNSIILTCRAPIGNIAITNTETCTNQGCKTLTKKQRTIPLFYYYFLSVSTDTLNGLGNGSTFKELSTEDLANFLIPIPPLQTQRQIATFLDRKTEAIDTLIEKKQQLIERLEEKRTALINHVVTKGLDPDAPMKDSGIEWIGEVPEGWEVKKLKFASTLQRGFDLPASQRNEAGNIPIYTGAGITGYHSEAMINPPGVVTGRYGTIGVFYHVDEAFWPLNTSLYVKDFWHNHSNFIFYLLQTLPFDAHADKSAVPGVNRNDLHEMHVAIPAHPIQQKIALHLDNQTTKLTTLTTLLTSQIEKLQEYRQALITAAVTGQIDVSGELVDEDVEGVDGEVVQEDQMSLL